MNGDFFSTDIICRSTGRRISCLKFLFLFARETYLTGRTYQSQ